LACRTQEKIAEAENVSSGTVGTMATEFLNIGNLAENEKATSSHATEFEVPVSRHGRN
jgi:hypothetical protein